MDSKRVVSFSLYGSLPIYTVGAAENAELVHTIYPGWISRFYIDETVPGEVVAALRERGAQIILVDAPRLGTMYGRYWRFWVAADPDVERFIVRDADSRVNNREKAAVAAWIKSGKSFHVMRDAFGHRKHMLGGMWGGVGGKLSEIRRMTDSWGRYSVQGECDQFVSEIVFPKIKHDCLCHDSLGHFDDAEPFPPHEPLQGTSFVGQVVPTDMRQTDVWRRLGEYQDEILRSHQRIDEQNNALQMELQQSNALQGQLQQARDQLANANKEIERLCREKCNLIENLKMPGGPRSLKFVLRVARLIRLLSLHGLQRPSKIMRPHPQKPSVMP